jgi:phage terminase large subunit-like protein
MALEGLYVSTNASWFAEFKRELLSFPAGKHDDQVDALRSDGAGTKAKTAREAKGG